MQVCTLCHLEKPLLSFPFRKGAANDRRKKCKTCTNLRAKDLKKKRRRPFLKYCAVSNLGRFRSIYGAITQPKPNLQGYCRVMIHKKGYMMHRLVACAFDLPRRSDQSMVDHIDSNKSNNALVNLRWASPSENVRYSYASGNRRASGMETLRQIRRNTTVPVLHGEIWRVVGHDEKCAVSNFGRYRNSLGDVYLPAARPYHRVNVDGRLQALHRLVATAFLTPPSDTHTEVHHIDGNPCNNVVSNLQWVTMSINIQASYENPARDRGGGARKGKAVRGRRTDATFWITYCSSQEASRQLGITSSKIRDCVHGKQRRCFDAQGVAYEFRRVETRDLPEEKWVSLDDRMLNMAKV